MFIFFALWSVVYSSGGFDGAFTLNQMIWYLTITECIELSKSRIYWDVQDEVKSGSIAYTIGRPYNYNLFHIFKSMGTSLIKIVPLLIMGFVIAIILGGSQAVSRSFFSSLIPEGKHAEFFGFYAISAKFASVFGPLLFAVIVDVTGSARLSILALTFFFVTGMLLLTRVKTPSSIPAI